MVKMYESENTVNLYSKNILLNKIYVAESLCNCSICILRIIFLIKVHYSFTKIIYKIENYWCKINFKKSMESLEFLNSLQKLADLSAFFVIISPYFY